jgi:ribosomal protein S18 acetylase RimI-like enzyme
MKSSLASTIKTAAESDRPHIFATLTAAFATDPMVRWTFPDDRQFQNHFPIFAAAFGGRAFAQGTAYCSADLAGAALWLPPGVSPDEEAMARHLEQSAPDLDAEAVGGIFEEMERYHPKEPHWYLPLIGVDPSAQGRGLGTALMRHALEATDRDRLPAYLESSNPRNIPLYERHGFVVMGRIQKGSSPPLFPMLRRAR